MLCWLGLFGLLVPFLALMIGWSGHLVHISVPFTVHSLLLLYTHKLCLPFGCVPTQAYSSVHIIYVYSVVLYLVVQQLFTVHS